MAQTSHQRLQGRFVFTDWNCVQHKQQQLLHVPFQQLCSLLFTAPLEMSHGLEALS